jgi:hypothetical protein
MAREARFRSRETGRHFLLTRRRGIPVAAAIDGRLRENVSLMICEPYFPTKAAVSDWLSTLKDLPISIISPPMI